MSGPGSDLMGTRQRNTLVNLRSKGLTGSSQAPYPQADPSTYGGYAAQVMGLQTQFAGAQALAKVGIGAAKAEFSVARNAAQQQRVADVTGSVNAALETGMVGSSYDLANRAQAPITAAASIQAALAARNSTIASNRSDMIGALGTFYNGLGTAQMDVANAEAAQAQSEYENNMLSVLTDKFAALRKKYLAQVAARGRSRDAVVPDPSLVTTVNAPPGRRT